MTNTVCIDEKYSTTRLLTKEKPIVENRLEDENRKGEDGLRTKGYFKKSFEDKSLKNYIKNK